MTEVEAYPEHRNQKISGKTLDIMKNVRTTFDKTKAYTYKFTKQDAINKLTDLQSIMLASKIFFDKNLEQL
jgi:predicted nicotinamide N-methyase